VARRPRDLHRRHGPVVPDPEPDLDSPLHTLPTGRVGIDPGSFYLASNPSERVAHARAAIESASTTAGRRSRTVPIAQARAHPFAPAHTRAAAKAMTRPIPRSVPGARPVALSGQ
jgi:hypothetical protein